MERHGWCIHSSVKSVFFFGQPLICLHCRLIYLGNSDPFARYVDAFTVNWALHPFYAFPPLILKGRCLPKKKKNLRWWSYRVYYCPHVAYSKLFWFFIKHVGRPATLLQDNQDNADKSFSAGTNLPAQGHFIGMQCQAIPCRVRDFRQKLPTSFCQRGVQLSNTMCTSRNGPFMGATVLLNFGLSSWFIYQTLPLFVPEHC